MQRSKTQVGMLAAGFGGLGFALVYLVLGALAPGYNALRDTISALEFTAFGLAQRTNFVIFGITACAFAVALRRELRAGRGAVSIPVMQCCSGVGIIGAGIFIDAPMHLICDLIAFNSALLVLFLFAWRFSSDGRWRGWTALSIATALLMMALLTAFGIASHLGGPAGAFEKLATVARTCWSALLVGRLYTGKTMVQAS
jgi:Protein of unknown function (DUF998)